MKIMFDRNQYICDWWIVSIIGKLNKRWIMCRLIVGTSFTGYFTVWELEVYCPGIFFTQVWIFFIHIVQNKRGIHLYWICFTVDAYWKYKFRNVSVPIENDTELTKFQVQWASNLSIASMYPKVAFFLFNALIGHKLKSSAMILTSLIISITLFIFYDVMTQINTDAWQFEFFVTTIIAVIIVNSTMAINQVFNHLNGILRQNYSIYL